MFTECLHTPPPRVFSPRKCNAEQSLRRLCHRGSPPRGRSPRLEGKAHAAPTYPRGLEQLRVSGLTPSGRAYRFRGTWATPQAPRNAYATGDEHLTVRIELVIRCGEKSGQTRRVVALTHVYRCQEGRRWAWRSSGDECHRCVMICEMAPSPIIPANGADALPLAQAIRLRLRVVAELDGALVLLAEHALGPDRLSYEWRASGGQMLYTDKDIAVWTRARQPGPHLLQVTAQMPGGAAVASLRRD